MSQQMPRDEDAERDDLCRECGGDRMIEEMEEGQIVRTPCYHCAGTGVEPEPEIREHDVVLEVAMTIRATTEEEARAEAMSLLDHVELIAAIDVDWARTTVRDVQDVPEDDDPQCVCGTYRSEHALCGCPEGFQTPAQWQKERESIIESVATDGWAWEEDA